MKLHVLHYVLQKEKFNYFMVIWFHDKASISLFFRHDLIGGDARAALIGPNLCYSETSSGMHHNSAPISVALTSTPIKSFNT